MTDKTFDRMMAMFLVFCTLGLINSVLFGSLVVNAVALLGCLGVGIAGVCAFAINAFSR